MRIHSLLLLLLAFAHAPPAAGQDSILRPGSAALDGEAIGERTDEFDVYEVDGDGTPVGSITLRTRHATLDGRRAIVRKEQTVMEDELVQVDSFALDRRTLAPLYLHSLDMGMTITLAFGPDGVRARYEGSWGADTLVAVVLPGPVFLAGSMDVVLGALPLARGYRATLAFYGDDHGFADVRVEVEDAEEVALPEGGRVPAWRVRVEEGEAAGTYWMDRESRALVQFENADGDVRIVRSRGVRSRARPTR